ncbi:hypothetical protein QR680_017345 [Steinernema hermaphroditum]|uniref:HP domain-containing protein n=1 Tax=Steinernema hermaphroditum TaxID=289476 RepID=A0AA39HFE0_9BILA|nr:hypothetical protein QR680_017345 [Steinernema hermaphroditum]
MDWKVIGVGESEGLRMWRVEKLELKELGEEEFGTFFSGDCYVILKTTGAPPREWNVHFWIGEQSSVDERFCAAFWSVELDDFLGGRATQFRESQHFESKRFLALFASRTVRYLDGGVASALRSASEASRRPRRLFKVKGRRNCRVMQVPLEAASLNQGDVFVLDAGDGRIFVWNGPLCNKEERRKGAEVARTMRDVELAGRASVEIIEDEWDSHRDFFGLLGSRPLPPCSPFEDDAEFERSAGLSTRLFRVSDDSGRLELLETASPLGPNSLDSNDCFFLDVASTEIFVWMGKGCTPNERCGVWTMVTAYLEERHLPPQIPVCKINEGQEVAVFRAALNWPEEAPRMLLQAGTEGSRHEEKGFDVAELLRRRETRAEVKEVIEGRTRVWRVNNFALEEVPLEDYGTFFSGDAYIVLFEPLRTKAPTVFFWVGRGSSIDERASAALFAAHIDEREAGGSAVQKRVVETKEPREFLMLFDDFLVTFLGGHQSGFLSRATVAPEEYGSFPGRRLFHIKERRVGEVPFGAERLNSNDVFVALDDERRFAWIGKARTGLERNTFEWKIGDRTVRMEKVREGEEPEAFWDFLGGKLPYASTPALTSPLYAFAARLFHASNAKGTFRVEEIVDFSQEDLESDDVMLLDSNDEIFVWIGRGANDLEKKLALELAVEYVSKDPSGRAADETSMWVVKEGAEPPEFRAHFPAWRDAGKAEETMVTVASMLECFSKSYSYDDLAVGADRLPFGVDPTRKEEYLIDGDFEKCFGMSKTAFGEMKKWKQLEAKKRVGLF